MAALILCFYVMYLNFTQLFVPIQQGTCANCDNVIRTTPVKCESTTGRRRELCSNECLKAWAKKEKEQAEVEEEVGVASSVSSMATTPPSSMSPSSGNGVSPTEKALAEVAPGRKGRLEGVWLCERWRPGSAGCK